MSPNRQRRIATGQGLSTVLAARDFTILAMGSIIVFAVGLMAILQHAKFPAGQTLFTALALPPMVAALITRGRDVSRWLAIGALLLICTSTMFASTTTNARITASVLIFMTCSFGLVSLTGGWRWIWMGSLALLWAAITPAVPLPVEVNGYLVNARWLTLPQLLVAGPWLASAWSAELERTRLRDEIADSRIATLLASIAYRERVRVWREQLTRIHETVLNDIRSVLDSPNIDWQRLRNQLAQRTPTAPPLQPRNTIAGLLEDIREADSLGSMLLIGPMVELRLSDEAASMLRAVLLELIRNLRRHSGATHISAFSVRDSREVRILLRHNGHTAAERGAAGIGLGVVINDALPALRARLELTEDTTSLRLPQEATEQATTPTLHPDTWRVVIATAAAGNAIGGMGHYLLAAFAYGTAGLLLATCALVTAGIAAVATWRRRALSPLLTLVAISAATAAPLIASSMVATCSRIGLLIVISTLSSIGAAAVVVWAPSARWMWLVAGSALGLLQLGNTARENCAHAATPGLLTALVAPLLSGIVIAGLRWSARQQRAFETEQADAVRQSAAASAARDFGDALYEAVGSATNLLRDAAKHESLTDEMRARLRCYDGEIRASIQVDPENAGAFARTGRELVHAATAHGIAVRVLALRDSGDRRPLPESVLAMMQHMVLAASDGSASVQAFAGPGEDTLVITASHATIAVAGIPRDWREEFEDGIADLDASDPEAPAMLMVQRRTSGS